MEMKEEGTETVRRYRPALSVYHPNGRCTGSAIKLSLHPAEGEREGYIKLRIANQLPNVEEDGKPRFPQFNWLGGKSVRLCFLDLCEILRVLRGETESIADGQGLFHRSKPKSSRLTFAHVVEPTCGYRLQLTVTYDHGEFPDETYEFMMADHEACGIMAAIENSMAAIVFGAPEVPAW